MNPPEGWPTDEMIEEGHHAYWHWRNDNADLKGKLASAFKAMYASAPTPPAQESNVNDTAMERIHEAAANGRCKDFPPEYSGNDLISDIFQWLSQPAQEVSTAIRENLITESSQKAEEDEPSYWLIKDHEQDDPFLVCSKDALDIHIQAGYRIEASLYTRPADDKLRKAAEEAEKLLMQLRNRQLLGASDFSVLWNLRAALEGK